MKKLGLSRYTAGLQKDEIAESYKLRSEDSTTLIALRDTSLSILRQTWRECRHGTQQRLTDPQAARISSFWHAADPEGKNKTFRRSIRPNTLEYYLNHWAQLLKFMWNGWHGKLFPQSLAAIRRGGRDDQSQDDYSSGNESGATVESESSSGEDGDYNGSGSSSIRRRDARHRSASLSSRLRRHESFL
ncbi:hypothetical protein M409DRAFT_61707 [Zasmidium cellare ATCC 36951]|uniref:Uncharacterized protein n=1 Tax=Zasmidium cellare ATCC 36951 TaxID=1080233 RepID=A0A6A6BUA5_ZASCE|nr:uncharacterized protein M409DRAFT_61707 [Zasmidium cellare ATCC 36951]KAF2158384.1 hypothetical protein M409DRAFT_61707 [Zasmidium cellare ATCC 36951]